MLPNYAGTRRNVHVGVTRSPRGTWFAQQPRVVTTFGQAPRDRDTDGTCSPPVVAVATGRGIMVITVCIVTIGSLLLPQWSGCAPQASGA